MRIDKSHIAWCWFSAALLAAAGAGYIWYRYFGSGALNGPRGGSLPGLIFGIVGTSFMIFAWLLSGRKRFRGIQHFGRAQFWMRGHLYLGLLAVPMIWFHGGFRHGGVLTSTLMWLLYAVVVAGIIGAIVQHFMPKQMLLALPNETVFEQIPAVRRHLAAEARCVAAVCGPPEPGQMNRWRARRRGEIELRYKRFLFTEEQRRQLDEWLEAAPVGGAEPMRQFYRDQVRPFIRWRGQSNGGATGAAVALADERTAAAEFARQRAALPTPLLKPLAELERLCGLARQLDKQARWQWLLHGWLYVHVPLSIALLVLMLAHIVIALRYSL